MNIEKYKKIELPAGYNVFTQGQSCENYIVVTSGIVKVFTRSVEGKELVLYRIKPNEVCVLTTSCLMGRNCYPAEAVTETAVTARVIPFYDFNQQLEQSSEFRQFVLGNFSLRLVELMTKLESIALESVTYRLSDYLFNHAVQVDHRITITHQEIANEIGTAREVVSRHLKSLEQQGVIALHRGQIELIKST